MSYIESHQSLGTNLKLKRLARALEIHPAQAIGHLQYLWWWAIDNVEDGHVGNLENDELACVAEWPGDALRFACALRDTGWIERASGKLHNWEDYAGRLLIGRAKARERMRAFRERERNRLQRKREAAAERYANKTRTLRVTNAQYRIEPQRSVEEEAGVSTTPPACLTLPVNQHDTASLPPLTPRKTENASAADSAARVQAPTLKGAGEEGNRAGLPLGEVFRLEEASSGGPKIKTPHKPIVGDLADPLEIPEKLKTPLFVAAWIRWQNVRKGYKKPKSWVRLFRAQLDWLATFDVDEAIRILTLSTVNEYQGLVPPKHGTKNEHRENRNGNSSSARANHPRNRWIGNEANANDPTEVDVPL